MKLRNKSVCYLKKKIVNKGADGEKYAGYSEEPVKIEATVYSKSGQLQEEQSGNVQLYQKNFFMTSLLQSQMKTELKLIGLKRKHSTWQPVMEYVCILLQIRNRITRLLQFIQ